MHVTVNPNVTVLRSHVSQTDITVAVERKKKATTTRTTVTLLSNVMQHFDRSHFAFGPKSQSNLHGKSDIFVFHIGSFAIYLISHTLNIRKTDEKMHNQCDTKRQTTQNGYKATAAAATAPTNVWYTFACINGNNAPSHFHNRIAQMEMLSFGGFSIFYFLFLLSIG